MRKIAFVTARHIPLTDDDRLALAPLAAHDIEVVEAVWGAEAESFSELDLVVVRSPWDWYERGPEFLAWLEALEAHAIVANPGLSKFLEKSYLRVVERGGGAVIPTEWIERGERADLARRMRARGWNKAVFKPALSANAARTNVVTADTAPALEPVAQDILASGRLMLQPFYSQVGGDGEWTFVFFDGVYSHALRKVAKAGDFRVQADYGGDVIYEPNAPAELAAQAERALRATGREWTYARVDGVVDEGRLLVMELEVVEPELFLRAHPEAPRRFADAIARAVRRGRDGGAGRRG